MNAKKRPSILISILIVLIAIRVAMLPNVSERIRQLLPEREVLRQTPQSRKTPTREEHVARAFGSLERQTGVNSIFVTGDRSDWLHSAYVVALYGDPDKATESIISRIQKKVDGKSSRRYRVQLSLLAPLGLTGTKRAEEFLLNAYKNPHTIDTFEKSEGYLEEIYQRDPIHGARAVLSKEEIEATAFTLKPVLTGLVYLDEEKYSPMVEAEYDKLLAGGQIGEADADELYKSEYYRLFPEASKQDVEHTPGEFAFMERYLRLRLEFHRDALVLRDTIREHGAEGAVLQMYNYEYAMRQWRC